MHIESYHNGQTSIALGALTKPAADTLSFVYRELGIPLTMNEKSTMQFVIQETRNGDGVLVYADSKRALDSELGNMCFHATLVALGLAMPLRSQV